MASSNENRGQQAPALVHIIRILVSELTRMDSLQKGQVARIQVSFTVVDPLI